MTERIRRLIVAAALALPPALATCKSSEAPKPQLPARIASVSGDAQTAAVGETLTLPLVVVVTDSSSRPVAGVSVAFAVLGGGGSVGTPSAITSANGQAQTTWTLGSAPGPQTASASVTGAARVAGSPLSFTATANPGPAKSVALQAGNNQKAISGTAAAVRPAVIVRDAFSNPAPGVTVTFAATAGSGSVSGAVQLSNASGIATVGSWTLGNTGPDTLTATITGSGITGNPVSFVDSSFALGPPAAVAAYVGNNGVGLAGWAVNVRPAVRVTDANGFAVPGVGVTFAQTGGGGNGTGLGGTTNTQGIAQVGSWVLGSGAGVNTMTATVTGSSPAGNPVTFADTAVLAGFTITIRRFGPAWPPQAQAAFDSAVAKWERIIYQPLAPTQLEVAAGDCGPGTPADTEITTGLTIVASVDSIDGPGKTLAEAGPCYLRDDVTGLTVFGVMVFDSTDIKSLITNGTINSVILHEMGHVLGFGTLWAPPPSVVQANCLRNPSTPPGTILDTYFSCPKAQAAFDSIGGTSYTGGGNSTASGAIVPVENCGTSPYTSPTCGAGTVNSHWREVVMTNELMTGFLNSGSNPLSIVSVAAQEDIGYVVNYAAADPYVHTFTAPRAAGAAPIRLGDDILHLPMYVIDRSGRVVRVIPPR